MTDNERTDNERTDNERTDNERIGNILYVLKTDHTEKHYSNWKMTQDSGVDLFVPTNTCIPESRLPTSLPSGVRCEMKVYGIPSGFWLVPRSSVSKLLLRMANSVGVIDASYRGEIIGMLDNRGREYFAEEDQRLLQIVAPNMQPIRVVLVDELSSTVRGEGAFGSTGS